MTYPRGPHGVGSVLALQTSRSLLSAWPYRLLVGSTALAYAVGAMLIGGMLYLPSRPLPTGWFFFIEPSGPGPKWTYPAILAGGPRIFLYLPLLSGILMTLSAAGVGLGMAVAVLFGVRLLRARRAALGGPAGVGAVAGVTPALIGLVTLGACCSTTAAATAGIVLIAQASGTNPAAVLANAWYLAVLQVVVVYLALLGQEQLGRIYLLASPPARPERTVPMKPAVRSGVGPE